jgi:putative transposase
MAPNMPRSPRVDVAGKIYHVLNRGNSRREIFFKEADYEAFEKVLAEGLEKYPVDLFSYEWMPNHWHMALSPREDGGMSRLLYWITMTHSQRYHAHYHTVGDGHVYQGRFKSFPVQDDAHFFVVCRYVERNALSAGLVEQAEQWRWGSLWNWCGGQSKIQLSPWPISRPPGWIKRVNRAVSENEAKKLQQSIRRGSPFGDELWTKTTAQQLNLESTLRPLGRPRKFAQTTK